LFTHKKLLEKCDLGVFYHKINCNLGLILGIILVKLKIIEVNDK